MLGMLIFPSKLQKFEFLIIFTEPFKKRLQ